MVKLAILFDDLIPLLRTPSQLPQPLISPYFRLIRRQLLASPTPRFAEIIQTRPSAWPYVPLQAWSSLFLYSFRVMWSLGCLYLVVFDLHLRPLPAPPSFPALALTSVHLLLALYSNAVLAASNATTIKRPWLLGVYALKFAYEYLLLTQLIHYATASTAVAWWKCMDKALRTACTAVFRFTLYLLGYQRAVLTTANTIVLELTNFDAQPPLPQVLSPTSADHFVSPRRYPPLPPIITPPDTDSRQSSACLRAQPPLPPIITPPDTDALSHNKLYCSSARTSSVTSKLARLRANLTVGGLVHPDSMSPPHLPCHTGVDLVGICFEFLG